MAVIKCKMCGGDLNVSEDMTVAECEYCGTKQTVPKVDDEKKIKLFERANRLRAACEFDKAAGVYESIVSDFEFEAEAYWGLVLCKYGIEYVDDPATKKKVPTCHRSSFESVQDDPNYEQALENADLAASSVYRKEAFDIEELRKGIIEVSSKEEPYDIFISYKELAENGDRTVDSVIAQDIYTELTERGYRVFFSRISLEDKLGTEYEPYIFAALNSAKLMLVVGTSFEHFNAVWVKNEWSRFLSLIASGKKKTLIPCFKDINPYDMPKEFAKLSAQDMGKVGAMQDLMRGVEKIIPRKKEEAPVAAPVFRSESDTKTTAAMKRGTMALEDGDFAKADEYFEQVLTLDAECAEAYWGKVLAAEKCRSDASWVRKRLSVSVTPRSEFVCPVNMAHLEAMNKKYRIPSYFETQYVLCNYKAPEKYDITSDELKKQLDNERRYYKTDKLITRAEKFASDELKAKLSEDMKSVLTEREKRLSAAEAAEEAAVKAGVAAYARNIELGNEKVKEEYAEAAKKRDADYDKACEKMKADTVADYEEAIRLFKVMAEGNYKDCAERIKQCEARIAEIKDEEKRKADAEAAAAAAAKKQKTKKTLTIAGIAAAAIAVLIAVINIFILPANAYSDAAALEENGQYAQAAMAYGKLGDYKDAQEKAAELRYVGGVWNTISAGDTHTVGLKSDGTVVAVGSNYSGKCDVSKWTDIVSVVASGSHTVGLRSDGTVVAVGLDNKLQCNVEDWTDIVAIAAGVFHTVGLRSDGTVVAVGDHNVSGWTDIVAIAASNNHTVGLRADGTVTATGDNAFGKCDVEDWTDIVAIAAGDEHTVGLRSDGTVVAVGKNKSGQCNVSDWTDIVAIAADYAHTVGLCSDGTVVAVGNNKSGQCDVEGWTDIVAIAAGYYHTVGVRADGTVVATAITSKTDVDCGQCNVGIWKDIMLTKRASAEEMDAKKAEKKEKAYAEAQKLEADGNAVKAAMAYGKAGDYKDAREKSFALWDKVAVRDTIAMGKKYTVGLKSDGTVVATGDNEDGQCDVADWTDIVAISAGASHTVGLRSDGTVVAVGINDYGQCNISGWSDIVAISAGNIYTVGLKSDGTVVATELSDEFTYNLGQCDVADWTDIVAISAGICHTVGLKSDGTVVSTEYRYNSVVDSNYGQCNVSGWSDIVAISAGYVQTLGLKADGTVVVTDFTGKDKDYCGQCDVSDWSDIVAISADRYHTVGIKSDGTVAAVGNNEDGQCDVGGWTDIKLPK